jgi:hypothetical protein
MRRPLATNLLALEKHLDACADRKARENLEAVKASGSGQGLSGRLNASQPSGLDRLRAFNLANGRPQG